MGKYLVSGILAVIVAIAAVWPFIDTTEHKKTAPVLSKSKISPKALESAPKQSVSMQLPDFAAYKDVKTKKRKFFDYLKPLVVSINKEISKDREFVLQLTRSPQERVTRERFQRLLKKYRVKADQPFADKRKKLLRRADSLPVELVLMQAANESAWGTSRFALQANNLFGQWCFRVGCGVVPEGRPEGKTYEVRKFNRPIESIRSYFHNLNTGYAYEELRTLRQTLRSTKETLDPHILAEGLTPYSTRREEYVNEIQNMIRINKKYI